MSTKKNSPRNLTKFHGKIFELEIQNIFTTAFFVKNYYLSLNFFQALQSALLKNETKSLLKKDASQLRIA